MENKNERKITVKIEGEKWQKALDKAFEKANKKAKIDGFRPGKAPKEIFLKKYGIESLFMDAGDLVLQDAYMQMIEENKDAEIVAQPDIELNSVDENAIEFVFTLTLKPEVKLGKYKGLKVKKEKVEVSKEEVDATIEQMRSRYAENVVKEGAIEEGDIAVIDFEGFKDGVAFEGGKGENYSLTIGSGTFIPGFEEQLIGLKKDEEKEIDVTFPEDYHSEDLKGAKATFKVKVNEVKQIQIPELGEEFFEDLGFEGVNDEKSLRKEVESTIRARKDADSDNKYIDDLLEAAAKEVEIDLPHNMVHEEIHRMIHQYEDHLKMQGLSLEQFLEFTHSTMEALEDQMHEEAEKRVTYRLMLEEIAKVEKIEITEEKAIEEAENLAEKYQMKKEEFLKAFGGIDMIKYDLTMRAAIDVLKGE